MNNLSYELPVGRGALGIRQEQAKRYFVITNGVRTETDYFFWLNDIAYDTIDVKSDKGLSLDDMLEIAERIQKKVADDYDGIIIVLDIDDQLDSKKSKKNLKKFLAHAKAIGVTVCLSNESFEIWLLAHKVTVPKDAGDRKKATKQAISEGLLDPSNKKSIVDGALKGTDISHALKETSRLRRTYSENILKCKPGTDVDRFVGKVKLK